MLKVCSLTDHLHSLKIQLLGFKCEYPRGCSGFKYWHMYLSRICSPKNHMSGRFWKKWFSKNPRKLPLASPSKTLLGSTFLAIVSSLVDLQKWYTPFWNRQTMLKKYLKDLVPPDGFVMLKKCNTPKKFHSFTFFVWRFWSLWPS